jgi:hypothetical protein
LAQVFAESATLTDYPTSNEPIMTSVEPIMARWTTMLQHQVMAQLLSLCGWSDAAV